MDSDSDESLSNLASLDYLKREISKLEKLVVEKTARSAIVGDVTGSGWASVASSNHVSGYRLLAGCRDPIIGGQSTTTAKCSTAFVVKPRRDVGHTTNRRAGTIVRAPGYLSASVGNREFKSGPGKRRASWRMRSTGAIEMHVGCLFGSCLVRELTNGCLDLGACWLRVGCVFSACWVCVRCLLGVCTDQWKLCIRCVLDACTNQ